MPWGMNEIIFRTARPGNIISKLSALKLNPRDVMASIFTIDGFGVILPCGPGLWFLRSCSRDGLQVTVDCN